MNLEVNQIIYNSPSCAGLLVHTDSTTPVACGSIGLKRYLRNVPMQKTSSGILNNLRDTTQCGPPTIEHNANVVRNFDNGDSWQKYRKNRSRDSQNRAWNIRQCPANSNIQCTKT